MRLLIKESAYRFTMSRAFEPKVDRETGAIRMDKETGLSLQAGEIVGFGPSGAEIFSVTVAADQPPKGAPGDSITLVGLVAIPWTTQEGQIRVSYRAQSVAPAMSSASKVA